jgi:hypothetical protein
MSITAADQQTGTTEPRAYHVGGATKRLVYSLALVPIVPAVSVASATALENALTAYNLDGLRVFQFVFSMLLVSCTIIIWRKAVLWTMGRRWLTALVSLIPFVQVAVNLPLWQIQVQGCNFIDFGEEFLRIGQHQLGVGLWVWVLIWIWWGWEKLNMTSDGDRLFATARISPTAKRLAAGIGMIPFLIGLFLISGEAMKVILPRTPTGSDSPFAETAAFAVMQVAAFALWTIIWRDAVQWSRAIRRRTIRIWSILVVLPLIALFVLSSFSFSMAETIAVCVTLTGFGLWVGWTMHMWPMKPEAVTLDPMGPRCMRCGYPLRGLRATRCPECGDEPTLDELWVRGDR